MSLSTKYRPQSGSMTRVRQPVMRGGLLDVWEERMPEAVGRAVERVPPMPPLSTNIDPFRTDEDDLLPQSVINLYREQLDDDGLDFLKRGPRSTAERLAFAQRVHPAAYRTAERLFEHDQRRFEAYGEIDPQTAFVGPDGIVYRRNADSEERLAARIRRGFEAAVGGYDRSDPVRLLAADRPVAGVSDDTSVEQGADDEQPAPSDRQSIADRREWWEQLLYDNPAENPPRAIIIDVPGDPYIALNPDTGEIEKHPAEKAPRFPPQRMKDWHLEGTLPSTAAGEGHPVIIMYPNGEQYVARHRKTGERLLAIGNKPLVIQADEAEQLGLAEWMPYTRSEPEAQVYVPSSLPPSRQPGQSRHAHRRNIKKYLLEEFISILLSSPAVPSDEDGKEDAQGFSIPRE